MVTAKELRKAADVLEEVITGLNYNYYRILRYHGDELIILMRFMADRIIEDLTKQSLKQGGTK